jgi:hypothetical protein
MCAPSPPFSNQRKVGRREVTLDVESGAIGRGGRTQTLPTRAKPALQVKSQTPAEQAAVALVGAAQVIPHAPQLAVVVSAVSHPLGVRASQLPKPVAQPATTQLPPEHTWKLTWASAQTVVQSPQWAGSTAVFAQKVDGATPQVVSPEPQVVPQTPPVHA